VARETGMPSADAQDDFLRARRRRALRRVSAALRGEISDVDVMLPFDEVVAALGRVSERDLGLQTIALDTIVGTVDRGREFDRQFRPTSARVRLRFERIAQAQRRGEGMPPIDVYRVGELHFVRDGHHRVAVSRAQGNDVIHARVIEVVTRVSADAQTFRSRGTSGCSPSASRCRPKRASACARATRGPTARWPRASRRGAFARCRPSRTSSRARTSRGAGIRRSTCPCARCCARPG
jgi:hypothetical protein